MAIAMGAFACYNRFKEKTGVWVWRKKQAAARKKAQKEAEQKAEQIVQTAEERAKLLVSGDTIVKEAKQKASEIVSQAQSRSAEIKSATSSYVDKMLREAEQYFSKCLDEVKKTSAAISHVKGGRNASDSQNTQQ